MVMSEVSWSFCLLRVTMTHRIFDVLNNMTTYQLFWKSLGTGSLSSTFVNYDDNLFVAFGHGKIGSFP